jgi:hypothetical protein
VGTTRLLLLIGTFFGIVWMIGTVAIGVLAIARLFGYGFWFWVLGAYAAAWLCKALARAYRDGAHAAVARASRSRVE